MTSSPGFNTRLFLTGALAFVATGMLSSLFGVALPVYVQQFGLTEGQGTVLLSMYGLGAFLTVVAGIMASRLLTLPRGLLAIAAGVGLLAAQLNWGLMLLGGGLAGVGLGILAVVVNRQFLAGFGARGPGMVGMVNAVFGLGAIISPLLFVRVGGLPGLVFGGIGVLALLTLPLVQPDRSLADQSPGLPHLAQWRLLILGFNMLSAMVEVGLVGLGPTALIAQGLDGFAAARLVSAFSVCFLLGRLSLYWLTRAVGSDLLFLISLIGTALCMILAATGSPAIGYVLAGGFIGMFFPTFYVWAIGVLGDARMGSVILCAGLSAVTICPVVLGLILGVTGEDALFAIMAATAGLLALALVPVMFWARRDFRVGQQEAMPDPFDPV
jgi:MFS transporter, FHS family, glucose/mannose:H+ symporter